MEQGKVECWIDSRIYQAGFEDDGSPYTAELFTIVAQSFDGHRWEYYHAWPGCRVMSDEEGYHLFLDIRNIAHAAAEAQLRFLLAVGEANDERAIANGAWREIAPQYGSTAYEQYEKEHRAWLDEHCPQDDDDINF